MAINDLELKLTTSRERIRSLLTKYMNEYLKTEIDFSRTRFFSYLIDSLSILVSDELFYNAMALNESFLDTATIPESISYLASYIGYKPSPAIPAQGTINLSFPIQGIQNGSEIIFDRNMYFYAGDVKYRIGVGDVKVYKSYDGNWSARLETSSGFIDLPREIQENRLYFNVEVEQTFEEEYNYMVSYDIRPFQFYKITDNIVSGQITDIKIYIRNAGSDVEVEWTPYDSLYLMGSETRGFVYNIFDNEFNITFGNGILGRQPKAGDNVRIVVNVTSGTGGNVINGTITSGDTVYYGQNTILDYTVVNPYSFDSGEDYEPPESIKSNAKKSFVAFNRLTSMDDFKNINSVIQDFPFRDSYTVLKRSDLKANEIDVYNVIFMNNEVVPSRTETLFNMTDNRIAPYSVFNIDGEDYYNIFEMDLDSNVNQIHYTYITKKYSTTGRAVLPIKNEYPFFLSRIEADGDYDANEYSIVLTIDKGKDPMGDPFDASNIKAELRLTGFSYDNSMVLDFEEIDDETGKYSFKLDMNMTPVDRLTVEVKFVDYGNGMNVVNIYESFLSLKQSLDRIVKSEVFVHSEPDHPTNPGPLDYDIWDVPLIKASWYDSLSDDEKRFFETYIISKMIMPESVASKKMINTLASFRFSNSTGYIKNIYRNIPSITINKKVIDSSELPDPVPVGYKVEVKGPVYNTSDIFYAQEGSIATFKGGDSTIKDNWIIERLAISKMIYDLDTEEKYFYNGRIWVQPQMKLPLKIEAILYTTDGNLDIQEEAKDIIHNYYDIIGHDTSVYRSDIIGLLQSLNRVKYVNLISPEIDLLYNYNISDFTSEELLNYTPEYLYVKREDINIKVMHYREN